MEEIGKRNPYMLDAIYWPFRKWSSPSRNPRFVFPEATIWQYTHHQASAITSSAFVTLMYWLAKNRIQETYTVTLAPILQ
jgi:hypothetical protein